MDEFAKLRNVDNYSPVTQHNAPEHLNLHVLLCRWPRKFGERAEIYDCREMWLEAVQIVVRAFHVREKTGGHCWEKQDVICTAE